MSEGRKHRHDWSQTRTLYVVLQGEFVLYRKKAPDETDDTLRILAPLLPEHRYLAGPWLTDWKNAEELPRGCASEMRSAITRTRGPASIPRARFLRTTPTSSWRWGRRPLSPSMRVWKSRLPCLCGNPVGSD